MPNCEPARQVGPGCGATALSERPREAPIGLTVHDCGPAEAAIFQELAPNFGIVTTLGTPPGPDAVTRAGSRNRSISVGHRSDLREPALRALKAAGVDYICTRSIGVDHIDLDAADTLGITVDNVAYAPDGVADHTLMLMLMAARDARPIVSAVERLDFRLPARPGRELRDMTVGVVGTGQIGRAVIERLHGFGCQVLAHPHGPTAMPTAAVVPLDELLRSSDIVTLHVPLTSRTFHILGAEEIDRMKSGAYLVNTARGALVDTAALLDALERGHLGGAALDVLEGEERHFSGHRAAPPDDRSAPPAEDDLLLRLHALPNVLLTPHVAYFTERAIREVVETTLVKCRAFERDRADG